MLKKITMLSFLVTLVFMTSIPSAQAGQRVTVMLDWYPNPVHVPIYLAQSRGYFAVQGLDVEILVPADPNDPLKLTAARKIDFAVSYQPSVLMARDRNIPVVSLGALVQHPLSCILCLKSSGIKTPADFKGRKIGYSVEPLYRVLFEAVAENAGLKKTDYELFRVGYNLSPPLLTGKIDAACGAFKNYEAIQIGLKGREVGIFPFEKYGIPDFYELVLIANSNFTLEKPALAAAFMKGLSRGIRQTLAEPKTALDEFIKRHPELNIELNRRSFDVTLPFLRGSPEQELDRWQKLQTFMLKRGLIKKTTPLRDLVWKPGR